MSDTEVHAGEPETHEAPIHNPWPPAEPVKTYDGPDAAREAGRDLAEKRAMPVRAKAQAAREAVKEEQKQCSAERIAEHVGRA